MPCCWWKYAAIVSVSIFQQKSLVIIVIASHLGINFLTWRKLDEIKLWLVNNFSFMYEKCALNFCLRIIRDHSWLVSNMIIIITINSFYLSISRSLTPLSSICNNNNGINAMYNIVISPYYNEIRVNKLRENNFNI